MEKKKSSILTTKYSQSNKSKVLSRESSRTIVDLKRKPNSNFGKYGDKRFGE